MSFDRNPASSISDPQETASTLDGHLAEDSGVPRVAITQLELWSARFPDAYVIPVAGGVAGAVSGVVSCPLDVIKTKLQAQGGFKVPSDGSKLASAAYHGVRGTAETIWREEGLRGMYRGLGPMLLGYVPTWAVYLTVYSKAQGYFNTKTESRFLANVYASVTAGACSTMATNPIWVIKTRLMSQSGSRAKNNQYRPPWHYRNTLDAAQKMYRTEGLKSFYSGLTPALLGLTHVAIQFPLYEIFKKRFTGIMAGEKETEEERNSRWYGLSFAVFLSKICASTATYPHEVVRTRLQTQQRSAPSHSSEGVSFRGGLETARDCGRPPGGASSDGMINILRYRGTIQTCKAILLEEGWRGFYAGLGTNLIRAVPSAMTTIITYEFLKERIFRHQREGRAKLKLEGASVI